ncbi:MAG: response regulator [Alteraurantiacibacter sp.]
MAHILIADEDDIAAELAAGMLVAVGHKCAFVSDAAEAWRLLRWRRPDLLLLDEAMPDESGASFLRRLRGSAEYCDLPVIVLSSGLDGDGRDVVGKPLEPGLLQRKVDHALQRPQQGEPDEWAEFQLRTRKHGPPGKVYL